MQSIVRRLIMPGEYVRYKYRLPLLNEFIKDSSTDFIFHLKKKTLHHFDTKQKHLKKTVIQILQ